MAEIPLRNYVEEIDNLIEKKQVDEAIAHCKQILAYYPKHLGTYQALGKALLEKGRHSDAADIFQRVLSAVPDDFVAHIGMSIVREDESNVAGALWHMERAFEVMPANTAIQEELRRLYGRRDGVMPPRARLTRGALARLYSKGGLFAQAEAELKKALADNPDRLDLKSVLAQVYWHTNRYKEAADICTDILQKLPYNQDANRMLADLLLIQGRTAEMVAYRQHLEALDPYAAFAAPDSDGHGSAAAKAETVMVPKLNYTPDMAASDASTPEWVSSIGETLEEPKREPVEEMLDWLPKPAAEAPAEGGVVMASELPQWLKGAQMAVGADSSRPRAESASTVPLGPSPVPPVPAPEADMPDWMKATVTTPLDMPDWMKAAPAPAEPPAGPVAEDSADWLSTTVTSSQVVPDWMQGLGPGSEAAASASAEAQTLPAIAFKTPTEPPAEAGAAPVPTASSFAAEELPDGLRAQAPAAVSAPTAPAAEAVPPPTEPGAMGEDEALRWLEGLALQQGAKPEELVTHPEGIAAQMTTPAAAEQPAAAPAAATPLAAEELPDWLREQAPAVGAAPATAAAQAVPPPAEPGSMGEDEALRWLEGLALQQGAKPEELVTHPEEVAAQTPAPAVAAQPEAAAPAPAVEELPDWLKAAGVTASAEELPDWLKEPAPAAETAPEATAEAPAPLAAAELPDWLKEKAPAAETAPAATAEAPTPLAAAELPDWLKEPAPAAETAPAPLADAPGQLAAAELPDWLKEIEAESHTYGANLAQPPAAQVTPAPPAAEPDKPDWLIQMEAEADAYEASLKPAAAVAPEHTKRKLRPDELPDFLQMATPESVARAEQPTHLAGEPEPEKPAEEPGLAAAQIPDWLKDMEAPAEAPEAEPVTIPSEPIQWLESAPSAPEVSPADEVAKPISADELPDWLRPSTAEAPVIEPAAPPPAAEVPNWVQEPSPGASDTVALWLAKKKIPDWLRRPDEDVATAQLSGEAAQTAQAAVPAGPALTEPPAVAAAPAPEATPAMPAAAAVEPAAAMPPEAGAPSLHPVEGLITKPLEEVPGWLAVEPLAAPETQAAPAPEQPAAPVAQMPVVETPAAPAKTEEYITKPLAEVPAWLAIQEAAATPAAAVGAEALGEAEALRWLESLALQQGARPEELVTKPEERLTEPPAWVTAEAQAAAPVAETPAPPAEVSASTEAVSAMAEMPAPPPAGVAPSPEALAAVPAEAPAPAVSAEALGEAEALRWLESLALQQGARPEELVTKPEERLPQPPAWVTAEAQAAAPMAEAPIPPTKVSTPTEAVSAPAEGAPAIAAKPAPPPAEVLAAPEMPAPSPAQMPAAPELPAAETPAPAVSAETFGEDEALRWLESLALQQGARPEELVTKPTGRLEQPPAWVTAEAKAAAMAAELPGPPIDLSAPTKKLAAPEVPAVPAAASPAPAVSAEAFGEDEALRWLESLALQQGARPEELVTKPTGRLEQPPAWVTAEAKAAEIEAEAIEPELPKISFAAVPSPEPIQPPAPEPPAAAAAEVPGDRDARLSKLAEKLASARQAKEADIEARFEAKRAEQEAARRAVQQKLERKTAEPEALPVEAQLPAAASAPIPAPRPPVIAEAVSPAAPPPPAVKPTRPAPAVRAPAAARPKAAAAPKARKIKLSKSPYAAHEPAAVLAQAHQQLDERNLEAAVEALAYLVSSGHLVQETIAEMETFSAQQHSAPLLQVLGDAYMKNNQLQKALDTYRQALGIL